MIGKKKAKGIINLVLKQTRADQAEVVIFNYDQALTRFANNYIHQNVNEANTSISVRVIFGKKIGSASTNTLDPKKIEETVRWAEEIARYQKENVDFVSLPKIKLGFYRSIKTFNKKTARFSNINRADAVAEIVDVAKRYLLTAYGSVSNGAAEVCIGNSLGTFSYATCNDIYCNIVMSGENSTGYAQAGKRNVTEIDFRNLAEIAAKKALMSADPRQFPPGQYTTIFEPLAAGEFLEYLAYYAFNGKMFQEGRSFLTGKLGTRVFDERITIIDDPFNENGFTFPFDFEGVPKKKLVLVNKGVAETVVFDSLTASRAKKKSTGHALSAPNPFGPVPVHLYMKGGDITLEEMIRETKKGILVTRFHYSNVIDPHKLIFTGMTRDGTFLIEDGRVTKGLHNLRFTENIVEALNRVNAISKDTTLVASEPGYGGRFGTGTITPAIKIRNFRFTSATEFLNTNCAKKSLIARIIIIIEENIGLLYKVTQASAMDQECIPICWFDF
jgi:PmbA protein